jgi:hypothetical protein
VLLTRAGLEAGRESTPVSRPGARGYLGRLGSSVSGEGSSSEDSRSEVCSSRAGPHLPKQFLRPPCCGTPPDLFTVSGFHTIASL